MTEDYIQNQLEEITEQIAGINQEAEEAAKRMGGYYWEASRTPEYKELERRRGELEDELRKIRADCQSNDTQSPKD